MKCDSRCIKLYACFAEKKISRSLYLTSASVAFLFLFRACFKPGRRESLITQGLANGLGGKVFPG